MVSDFDVVIAGTEPITDRVMSAAPARLKLISRVGIGLDSVDLLAAERRGIKVAIRRMHRRRRSRSSPSP